MKEGIRAGWGYITYNREHNIKLIETIKEIGLNLLWGVGEPQKFTYRKSSSSEEKLTKLWKLVAERLENTDIKWFIGMNIADSREGNTKIEGAQGQTLDTPSPLDWNYWEKEILTPLKICANFSKNYSSVGGIIIDLELYGLMPGIYNIYQNYGFEDTAYSVFVEKSKRFISEDIWKQLRGIPLKQRFHWLKDKGILELYYKILENTITEYAKRVRNEVQKINPDLVFGFYQLNMPSNWFSRGIMRGFSSPERPALLFTFETTGKPYLEILRNQNIYLLNAEALLLGMKENYSEVIKNSMKYSYGYWLNRITWLVKTPSVPYGIEIPYNKTPKKAINDLKKANQELNKVMGF